MSLKATAVTDSLVWRDGQFATSPRTLPAEVPVAFVYDGSAEAVMMATPADCEDFALGFSLNDRIISGRNGIASLEIIEGIRGIELRIAIAAGSASALTRRRRRRFGPVGCGLCGVESLEDALPALPPVSAQLSVTPAEIIAAMREMSAHQSLNRETRAVHAAGFFVPGQGIVAVREDVGRHNALDKLAGALARAGRDASEGVILMTSRLSVELVQKAAVMVAPVIAAVSAPTALAVKEAEAAGITVAGIVRDDGLEIFTHATRFKSKDETRAG